MPDIPDRLTREDELTRDLTKIFVRQRRVVRSAKGQNVPWTTFQAGVEQAFVVHLSATFEIARRLFLEERAATEEELALFLFLIGQGDLPFGTTPRPAGQRTTTGQEFAQGVAGPLAARVTSKSQEGVSRAKQHGEEAGRAADGVDGGPSATVTSNRVFNDAIKPTFSTDRAESISITETTGAISAGEDSGARIVEQQDDVILSKTWVTEADARVCPICRPLHLKPESFWPQFPNGPPAHPRCRCWLVWVDNNGRRVGRITN